jgi:hypothetical protein
MYDTDCSRRRRVEGVVVTSAITETKTKPGEQTRTRKKGSIRGKEKETRKGKRRGEGGRSNVLYTRRWVKRKKDIRNSVKEEKKRREDMDIL